MASILTGHVIFSALIQAVHQIEGIRRIRLGSLEPGIITEEFARSSVGTSEDVSPFPSVSAERMRRHIKADEPQVYQRRVL